MTICVAARSNNFLVLASDQMLTAGDIQFEPPRKKIVPLTNSIFACMAGDTSFSTMVITDVAVKVANAVRQNPTEWLAVRTVVDWYIDFYSAARLKAAETAILQPLGLTAASYLDRQSSLAPSLVIRIMDELTNYQVPQSSVIISGRDPGGSYIFTIHGSEVDQHDTTGFAAIGSGGRHAQSHFMQVGHAWNADLVDTVVRTYTAKRRAEAAPGVGRATDMFIIGPELGVFVEIGAEALAKLRAEYDRMVSAERRAEKSARKRVAEYIDQVTTAAQTSARQQPEAES